MNFFVALSILVIGLVAQAQIEGSRMSDHQQSAIAHAVNQSCGTTTGLKVISQTEELVSIDQGIQDALYTTVLQGQQAIDQYLIDTYEIVVKSGLTDAYDHQKQVWGIFTVYSVVCNQL
jgi:hypothetical protein